VLAFRLAAEAPQLADRFILSNGVHPPLSAANIKSRVMSTSRMLHTWIRTPSQIGLLSNAFGNIRPVLKQVIKSGYVFAFNLPTPMVRALGSVGDFWLLRFLNAMSVEPDPDVPLEGTHGAETLAGSVGPSGKQCSAVTMKDPRMAQSFEIKYSRSVRRRATNGGFVEKLGLYRHGCVSKPWEKSLENLWDLQQLLNSQQARRRSLSSSGIFDVGPEGVTKAPTTVIWGEDDVAIENCIAVEGFADYFGAKESNFVMASKCGHWTPVEKQGAPIFQEVIAWALEGEQGSLRTRLGNDFPLAKVTIEK
jgi:pimeloyl-ACP methyl ester carboxylesterase